MNVYLLMKLLHVLAAFWMVSGVIGRGLTSWETRRMTDVQAVSALFWLSEFP